MILNNISKCHFKKVPQWLVPLLKSATMKIPLLTSLKSSVRLRVGINSHFFKQFSNFTSYKNQEHFFWHDSKQESQKIIYVNGKCYILGDISKKFRFKWFYQNLSLQTILEANVWTKVIKKVFHCLLTFTVQLANKPWINSYICIYYI